MTEEEMRLALFGMGGSPARQTAQQSQQNTASDQPAKATAKRKNAKNFVPKLIVTLRVGNEFEGATELFTHPVHTLSRLQAELDAMKEARKKYKYIELVSVKSSK